VAIKAVGVACVIAKDFARIFYRNSFNIGLPIFESEEASKGITQGDEVEIDADKGVIRNITKGKTYKVKPIPPFMQELVAAGGLIAYGKAKYKLK
jgi:3-isopropylmalate/(R)-2-methylmalate dehydratase small subunit